MSLAVSAHTEPSGNSCVGPGLRVPVSSGAWATIRHQVTCEGQMGALLRPLIVELRESCGDTDISPDKMKPLAVFSNKPNPLGPVAGRVTHCLYRLSWFRNVPMTQGGHKRLHINERSAQQNARPAGGREGGSTNLIYSPAMSCFQSNFLDTEMEMGSKWYLPGARRKIFLSPGLCLY